MSLLTCRQSESLSTVVERIVNNGVGIFLLLSVCIQTLWSSALLLSLFWLWILSILYDAVLLGSVLHIYWLCIVTNCSCNTLTSCDNNGNVIWHCFWAQIVPPSYSPCWASIMVQWTMQISPPPIGISVLSAIFAAFTYVTNTETDTHTGTPHCV